MQQGNFINVFLARHVSGTYAHHQEHWMLGCSIWLSAPSFLVGWWSWEPLRRSIYAAAYVPETCRAKNTLIKLPCCVKFSFQVISF